MNLNKIFFAILCCGLQLIAQDNGASSPEQQISRSSTPDTVSNGSFFSLDGLSSAASAAANLVTPKKSPDKEQRTFSHLNNMLGGDFLKNLFLHELPKDLQNIALHHPDILTGVAISAYAYLGDDMHKTNPDKPNEKTVHDYIKSLGFTVENLAGDLILLTRTTADGVKQAWFSVTGTNSISDAMTSIGIGTHINACDYHDFMVSVWSDHIAPKFYSENSYCASALNYVSNIQMNLYHMCTLAYFMFGSYNALLNRELYTTYSGLLYTTSCIISMVLYWNIIPNIVYKTRYKPHTNRLLTIIRARRRRLQDDDFTDFFVTGHSLGGHLAQILGLLTNCRVFSFNAPGGALQHALWSHESLDNKDGIIKPTSQIYKDTVLSIVTEKDPVSALQHQDDPIEPVKVKLNGVKGILTHHMVLPIFWAAQEKQA